MSMKSWDREKFGIDQFNLLKHQYEAMSVDV